MYRHVLLNGFSRLQHFVTEGACESFVSVNFFPVSSEIFFFCKTFAANFTDIAIHICSFRFFDIFHIHCTFFFYLKTLIKSLSGKFLNHFM